MHLTDNFGRVHDYLRISLTDRCNLNCTYCNPVTQNNLHSNRDEILTFDEINRLIKIFAEYFNVKKIRFTGGEPLVRKGFLLFVSGLAELKIKFGFKTAITTNGVLLAGMLGYEFANGIDHLNISLDSLDPEVFKNITGKNELGKVLEAINKAKKLPFGKVKINCVIMRGINDNEIIQFADFAVNNDINVRFIEYMPFTNNGWNEGTFISSAQIKKIIEIKYILEEIPSYGSVAKDFYIKDNHGKISFISSISNHFCTNCSRLRITAKGSLRPCLFSEESQELNLRDPLRNPGVKDHEIAETIMEFVKIKSEKHPQTSELMKMDFNYMLRNGG